MEQIEQRSVNIDKGEASNINELKWETPTNGWLIWMSLFFLFFLTTYFVVVLIFSDIGVGVLFFIGLAMVLIFVITSVLHIELPWQWGTISVGGSFFIIFIYTHLLVGFVNTIIVYLLFYVMFFSLLFGLSYLAKKTTRTLTFQYQNGFSETFNNGLIEQIEEWLANMNIPFKKALQETYDNRYFVIEPPNREEITLIVQRDFKGDVKFHKLTLKVTRKDGISSLVDYETYLLDMVKSMIRD